MAYENSPLHVNTTEHKFEMVIEGQQAFIDYRQTGKKVYLVHTEVPPAIGEKGVGKALVEKTFTHLEKHQLQLVPLCGFVRYYLQKHPDWNKLVVSED